MAGRTHCISNEDTRSRRLIAASLITLLLLIFIVDLIVPWGYAVPILYLLPLILTLWLPSAVTPLALAGLCTALLTVGFLQSTTIFRITQELVTNIARHARASQATVKFMVENDHLTVTVHDDGKGITEKEMANADSLGLRGIQERIALLGGHFEIYGLPGEGTSVQVRIPNICHPGREGRDPC